MDTTSKCDPGVRPRVKIEETIVLALIDELLAKGCAITVDDSEEKHGPFTDRKKIIDAVMNTDEDYLLVFLSGNDTTKRRHDGWIRLTYGNSGWDVIGDYSINIEDLFTDTRELADKIEAGEYRIELVQPDPAATARARLEYLRGELKAERISYDGLHELQSLAPFIEPGDVELLEAAGVPEHQQPPVKFLDSRETVVENAQGFEQHSCDNCDWKGTSEQLRPIKDLAERIEAGGEVPSGECPECGALCYPVKPEPAKPEPAPEHCKTCEDSRFVPDPDPHRAEFHNVPCPDCTTMTAERRAWYLANGAGVCPFCFGESISGGSIEIESQTAWQEIDCPDCNRSWHDIYTMSSVELPQ